MNQWVYSTFFIMKNMRCRAFIFQQIVQIHVIVLHKIILRLLHIHHIVLMH